MAQVEASSQGILILDAGDHVVAYNQRFLETWQLDGDAMSEDIPILCLLLDKCEKSSFSAGSLRPDQAESSALPPENVLLTDGRTIEVSFTSSLEPGDSGPTRIWHFRDVTETDVANVQLKMLWRAVDCSPAAVVITDRVGSIQYVNQKFTALTGYTHDEAIGSKSSILKSGVQDNAFYLDLWRTITDGSEWHGDFCNRRKDGTLYWERASISPICNQDGAISHFVAVKEDITAQRDLDLLTQQALEQLTHAALHDPLTGLPNRTLLADRLTIALATASRNGGHFAVVQVDLTQFKEINDTYGHDSGDILLKIVGQRMCRAVRASDTVVRTGGDEFVLILPGASDAIAAAVAQKLRAAIRQPIPLTNLFVTVDASFGIALYPDHGMEADVLLRRADQAMYVAKATRCGVTVFECV